MLDYSKLENTSRDVILFVHGALADKQMWLLHQHLLSHRYETIAITQRHFDNQVDSKYPFGLDTHAKDLNIFISELNQSKLLHIVAWSYGADVVLNLLANYENVPIKSIFLYEPGYPAYLTSDDMQLFIADAEETYSSVFELVASKNMDGAVIALINATSNQRNYFHNQHDETKAKQLAKAYTLEMQLEQSERPEITPERLSQIKCLTTVAYGQNTRPLFQLVSKAAAEHIPGAKDIMVESSGHMLPIDDPEKFVKIITTALALSSTLD